MQLSCSDTDRPTGAPPHPTLPIKHLGRLENGIMQILSTETRRRYINLFIASALLALLLLSLLRNSHHIAERELIIKFPSRSCGGGPWTCSSQGDSNCLFKKHTHTNLGLSVLLITFLKYKICFQTCFFNRSHVCPPLVNQ